MSNFPELPETSVVEPIVQCGVLYLGTAVPSLGRRALESVQEPLSHRYPIDGTNTVRGIDAILSIYENGIQLSFVRHPHVVIFYPLASLIYCASVRYSIVENSETSALDWRFIPLDPSVHSQSNKHPPLFCAVFQRTQILSGNECHCFITKNDQDALTLVRTVSEIYGKLPETITLNKSPMFYQCDRFERKISETTGIIYMSPATDDESLLPKGSLLDRNYLLDPSYDGFFYRTDTTVIEQWQLWDDERDDQHARSRPCPPPSPFGQHEGLYHDDLSSQVHHYLRQMDDEETLSDSSSTSSSSSPSQSSHHHHWSKLDRLSRSHTSSFDPTRFAPKPSLPPPPPIVIEKVVPNPKVTEVRPPLPPMPRQPIHHDQQDEVLSEDGNRIVYTDVVRADQPNRRLKRRSRDHRTNKIPVIDLRDLKDRFHRERNSSTVIEGFFEDNEGRKTRLTGDNAEKTLKHLQSSQKKTHRRTISSPIIENNDEEREENPSPAPRLEYDSPLRYMQSSLNPLLLEQYRRVHPN